MPKHSIRWLLPLLGAVVLAGSASAQQKMVRLVGTNSPRLDKARALGRLDAKQPVQFAFTLPVQKQAELDDYLRRLYTPGDPLYRQFLRTGEFESLFGPTQAQYDALIAFAERSGLRVVTRHSNRLVLNVAAPAETVETALNVRLLRFQSAANGRESHAPDQEPALPADVAALVSGVVGLDTTQEPRCNSEPVLLNRSNAPLPSALHGPSGGFAPTDIKTAYHLNGLTQDGTNQTIALVELDGFYASDVTAYEDQFGFAHSATTPVAVGDVSDFPRQPTAKDIYPTSVLEVALDIDMVKALAPNATLFVYEGHDQVSVLNKIASDNSAQQVSTSWYFDLEANTPAATRNGENTALQQLAAQGQTVYSASGDYGDKVKTTDSSGNVVYTFGVQDIGAQPYVTAVGGTSLTVDNTTGAIKTETAWTGDSPPNGGSGGGVSTVWTLPSYQSRLVVAGSGGSSAYRNVPDVALNGAFGTPYAVYMTYGYPTKSAAWITAGGTSAAAPLWAAFTAMVNQRRVALNTGRLGFANPTIYFVAHVRLSPDFHDMTVGNNGTYPAVAGYDNVTGWGSFDGGSLFNDLTVNATVFHVDANYTGSPANGGQTTPFKKITDALNAASASTPTLIYIRGAAYNETFTTSKSVVLVNDGNGNATLGSSTVH